MFNPYGAEHPAEVQQRARWTANNSSKQAHALLASKGARAWTSDEQATFDNHCAIADGAREYLNQVESAKGGFAAGSYENLREGLEIFLRKPAARMTAAEARKVKNTMSTTTGSQGGYTTNPLVASDLVGMIKGYGWMRVVAKEITTESGEDMTLPTSDGTGETGEILTQNSAAALLDPSFGAVPVNTFKFSSKVFTVPMELLQDSAVDVVGFVMERGRERIGRLQNQKFTLGTGTGEPFGLVTQSSVGKVGTTGQTLTIVYDDLADMIDSVDEGFLGMPTKTPDLSAVAPGWMFSQTMRKVIRKVKDSSGRPIWTPSYDDGVAEVTRAQLLDYPVYINNDMPVPAANAKSLAFGNLSKYLVRDVLQATLFRFDDSAFWTKGQIGFLVILRSGGNLVDAGAVKLYQHSAT